MYWDQATGAPINVSISLTSTSQNSNFSYILTYSSVWTVPEFSPIAFALFTFTLTSATVAIAHHEKARVRKKAMLLVT
jgi:hypothetical protein